MNHKILSILQAIIRNVDALNEELLRLSRTEQFEPHPECYELIRQIKSTCNGSIYTAESLDKLLREYASIIDPGSLDMDKPQ